MFEKWILKRAEKIKAEKTAQEKVRVEDVKATQHRRREIIKEAKEILNNFYSDLEKTMEPDSRMVKAGDRAILNIYDMLFENNVAGWDGGPRSLLTHTPKEDQTEPMYVNIKSVGFDRSLAWEKVDRFVNKYNESELKKWIDAKQLVTVFKSGKTSNLKTYLYGLYFSAQFETETTFHPTWTLNLSSFLKEGTEEAIITEKVWKEEIQIEKDLKVLNERKKEICLRKREIDEKYKGIRIIS